MGKIIFERFKHIFDYFGLSDVRNVKKNEKLIFLVDTTSKIDQLLRKTLIKIISEVGKIKKTCRRPQKIRKKILIFFTSKIGENNEFFMEKSAILNISRLPSGPQTPKTTCLTLYNGFTSLKSPKNCRKNSNITVIDENQHFPDRGVPKSKNFIFSCVFV